MTRFRFMSRRKQQQETSNGRTSPDERQRDFLRKHEERMRKVDEAVANVKRLGKRPSKSGT